MLTIVFFDDVRKITVGFAFADYIIRIHPRRVFDCVSTEGLPCSVAGLINKSFVAVKSSLIIFTVDDFKVRVSSFQVCFPEFENFSAESVQGGVPPGIASGFYKLLGGRGGVSNDNAVLQVVGQEVRICRMIHRKVGTLEPKF